VQSLSTTSLAPASPVRTPPPPPPTPRVPHPTLFRSRPAHRGFGQSRRHQCAALGQQEGGHPDPGGRRAQGLRGHADCRKAGGRRSEEHTAELQSRENTVCRLLLEKKKGKVRRVRRRQ